MVRKILVYSTNDEADKRLDPFLEREEVFRYRVDQRQELFEQLDCEDIHMVIMEIKSGQNELLYDLQLVSEIRKMSSVPIIVISSEESESIKIMMLNSGADDYILESCSSLEIVARIEAQLRRYILLSNIGCNNDRIYRVGELVIDDRYKKVLVNGNTVNLTPIEYKILKLLVQERGKAISISQIYETIWHMKAVGVDNTIAVHICHIREKIEENPKKPQYLKVVWGTGYKVG